MPPSGVWTFRIFLVAFLALIPHDAPAQQPVRVAFLLDGPWERNDEIRLTFEQELLEILQREFGVRFPVTLEANWTVDGVHAALDTLLSAPNIDFVVTLGVIGSADAARRGPLPKPVIAPFVLDIGLPGIPLANGASGVPNLSYIAFPDRFRRDLEAFKELAGFDRVTVLTNARYVAALPELGEVPLAITQALDIEATIVLVDQIDDALAALTPDVQAVYLAPLIHLPTGEFDRLVAEVNARGIPSFSLFGAGEVARGVLAGLSPDNFWLRIARRVALNTQRILLGEPAASLPVAFARDEQLTINMATARAIGIFPSWSALTEATLINEVRREAERELTLAEAVREAVEANLDLAAEERAVAVGAREVARARSQLLPQAAVAATGTVIDRDRAEASVGNQAQRTITGSVTFSQLIFSERAWANMSIQGRLQTVRELERDAVRLDIARDATIGYLTVLRLLTVERIRRQNLNVTRSELDLARVRQEIGAADPGEVFRLESEVAADRQEVIRANAQRNQAEIQLNRLLHRPLEDPFTTVDAGLEAAPLVGSDRGILRYMDNPFAFRVFRAFMVEEAFAASPELRQLDAAIAAQERFLSSSRRSFWTPTVALQAGVTNLFSEGGAGTTFSPTLPPGSPDLTGVFPQANDLSWNVALRLSLPIFEGGDRIAVAGQAAHELERLRLLRRSTAERIEQGVRSALHVAGASYASIDLARTGAAAARDGLDVVTDAFSRGVARLVDLLDAQNAAVVSDLVAANTVYDFLVDLAAVERAVGRFHLLAGPDERAAFFERLGASFAAAGISPTR